MKQTNWATGLARLASMCFRSIEKLQVAKATFRGSKGIGQYAPQSFQPVQVAPGAPPDPFQQDGIVQEDDNGEPILLPRDPPPPV